MRWSDGNRSRLRKGIERIQHQGRSEQDQLPYLGFMLEGKHRCHQTTVRGPMRVQPAWSERISQLAHPLVERTFEIGRDHTWEPFRNWRAFPLLLSLSLPWT